MYHLTSSFSSYIALKPFSFISYYPFMPSVFISYNCFFFSTSLLKLLFQRSLSSFVPSTTYFHHLIFLKLFHHFAPKLFSFFLSLCLSLFWVSFSSRDNMVRSLKCLLIQTPKKSYNDDKRSLNLELKDYTISKISLRTSIRGRNLYFFNITLLMTTIVYFYFVMLLCFLPLTSFII